MANITNDSFIFHTEHIISSDDIAVAGTGYKDIAFGQGIFEGCNLKAFHGSLKRTDGINFGNNNAGAIATHTVRTTFTHIAITKNNNYFAGNHHICSSFNTISK